MTKKCLCIKSVWTILKIGAWVAFALLMILFFSLIPVSLEACANPKIGERYMIKVYVCVSYIGIYFWLLILRTLKGKTFKTMIAIFSILIFISCGFLINTTITNKRIQILENRWYLSLPHDAKLEFYDYHVLGFIDQDTFTYYSFALKSPWTKATSFLNNHFPYNTDEMRYMKFPEQKNKMGFQLVFQELLEQSLFDLPNKICPEWNEPFQWGMRIGGNKILLGLYFPKTKRLILFAHGFYD